MDTINNVKKCWKCQTEKLVSEFAKNKSNKTGLQTVSLSLFQFSTIMGKR